MKKTCCVSKGKEKCKDSYYGWIDVRHPTSKEFDYCRLPFCEKHWKQVMKYVKQKEKEMQKKEGKNVFFAVAPFQEVQAALNQ